MRHVPAGDLIEFTARVLEAVGVPHADARLVAVSLVGSNLRGHDSHGVMRLPQYVGFVERGEYTPGADLVVERDGPALLVCDGQWGFGQVQTSRLLALLAPKARAAGVAVGAGRRFGHIGRLGEYAEWAVAEGLILIASVNNCGAGQRVAPPGGREPRLGTNPLCVGIPTEGDPIVLDFGTSVVAEGKVRSHHISKSPVPEGWLLDADGRPTTDPSVLYRQPQGSILPMGGIQGYKGFGLSLVLDMLVGGLSGGQTAHPGAGAVRGNDLFFLLLDPEQFAGRDALLREATVVATHVRDCPRVAGVDAILLPGDPERRVFQERDERGIPLPEAHREMLVELGVRLGTVIPASLA